MGAPPCEISSLRAQLSRNRSWHRVDDASQQLPAGDLWKEPRIEVMDIFMLFSLAKLWISSPKHGEDNRFSFFQRFWRRRSNHTKILSRAMNEWKVFFFSRPKNGGHGPFCSLDPPRINLADQSSLPDLYKAAWPMPNKRLATGLGAHQGVGCMGILWDSRA